MYRDGNRITITMNFLKAKKGLPSPEITKLQAGTNAGTTHFKRNTLLVEMFITEK